MVWSLSIFAKFTFAHIALFVGCLGASTLMTYILRFTMPKVGLVCRPTSDRWSRSVIPLGGGVGIFLASAPFLIMVSWDLFVACSTIFVLGIIDDRGSLRATTKLVIQTLAACWLVAAPLSDVNILSGDVSLISSTLQILCLVLVTNSFNLLDNVDGSSAGVCAISSGFLCILAMLSTSSGHDTALAAIALAGACLGFLTQNFPPAKIFMGDAGSLYLGFTLTGLYFSLPPVADSTWVNYLILFFIVGTPVFDTALVWFTRWSISRPFLRGGKDHVAHRLIALGFSERKTLLVIYGITATLGGVSVGLSRGDITISATAATLAGVVMIFFGLYLGEVPVYLKEKTFPDRRRTFAGFLYYGVELLLDVLMMAAAWIFAWFLRFDDPLLSVYLSHSGLVAIPLVIAIKVAVVFGFRLYRGVWRTIEFNDLTRIFLAALVACAALYWLVATSGIVEVYSRGVLAIDAILTFLFIAMNRSALRLLRHFTANLVNRPQRAILVGPKEFEGLLDDNMEYRRMYKLVGVVPADLSEAELEIKAKEWQAEVALVADAKGRSKTYEGNLAKIGLGLRHLSVTLD